MDVFQSLKCLDKRGSYFLYDLDALFEHAQHLKRGAAHLFFACKANPLSSILSTLDKAGIAFDVASEGELTQVLSLGIPGERIIMTGPAKPERLLRLGLKHHVRVFVIESQSQLEALEILSQEYDYQPHILLRLQLQWDGKEENVLGGKQVTPFGMDPEVASHLLSKTILPCLGFHLFQWGNILSIDKLREIWETTIQVCKSLSPDLQVVDVGGGMGIPYHHEDEPLDPDDIDALVRELKAKHKIPEFWLEMGRYMTGPYGYYATPVVDRKKTYGQDILVLEGGINHLARPALTGQPFPAHLLRDSKAPLRSFALHGPLCTSLDFLGRHTLPEDISIGDTIVFKQVGAYGFTESMPFFLCHQLPGECIIKNGKMQVIREPQPASTYLK